MQSNNDRSERDRETVLTYMCWFSEESREMQALANELNLTAEEAVLLPTLLGAMAHINKMTKMEVVDRLLHDKNKADFTAVLIKGISVRVKVDKTIATYGRESLLRIEED